MISYFFNRGFEKEVLYVPKNLIVITKKDNYDINYYVNNLKAFDEIWKKDKTLILGDLESCVIDIIDIPDSSINRFISYCFSESEEDIINAHVFSINLFESVKQEVCNFRRRQK